MRVERLFVINMNERKSASVNVFDVAFDSVVTNEKEGKESEECCCIEISDIMLLVGKITELYAAKGDDPPFGLASSDLATLRRHLERMRDRK